MPGGNSTSRPYNREEKQAASRRNQRLALGTKILNEADKGNIDKRVAEKEMKALFKTEGAKKDSSIMSEERVKQYSREIGKKNMVNRSTPKGTGKGGYGVKSYNKGGYCGASNPAARPMKKSK